MRLRSILSCMVVLAAAVTLLLPSVSHADAALYKLKAVYLFNFTNYVTWPNTGGAIPVCIYKDSDVENALRYIAQKQPGLSVRSISDAGETAGCAIVYVGASASSDSTVAMLHQLSGKNILSVGDKEDFINGGGMIELFVKDDKLKIRINRSYLENAGLKASSKLLEMAELKG